MNTIQLNFYKNKYTNIAKINNTKTNNLSLEKGQYSKSASLNPSVDNLKANYAIKFTGGIDTEKSNESGIGVLNHQTAFFREPKTDEIVQKYVLEKFGNDDEINIVSGANSTGEEAKSYAMMLDSLSDRLHIYGFDISSDSTKAAQGNSYQLL